MATNGRCIAFLETALTHGTPGETIAVQITDVSVVFSFLVDFVLECYAEFASGPVKDIRSVCHKFPMEMDDPVIRGFRHKRRGDAHHIAVLFAPEIQNSRMLQELKHCINMEHIVWNMRQFFSAFQPITDRSKLSGKCRRRSDYDRPRLMLAAHLFGLTWGFQPSRLVEKYRVLKTSDQMRIARPLKGKPVPSSKSARAALRVDKSAQDCNTRQVPHFGLRIPRWRGNSDVSSTEQLETAATLLDDSAGSPSSPSSPPSSPSPPPSFPFGLSSLDRSPPTTATAVPVPTQIDWLQPAEPEMPSCPFDSQVLEDFTVGLDSLPLFSPPFPLEELSTVDPFFGDGAMFGLIR